MTATPLAAAAIAQLEAEGVDTVIGTTVNPAGLTQAKAVPIRRTNAFADPGLGRYSLSQTWTDWPEGILLPVVMAYTPRAARFQEYLDYAMRHRTEILIGLGLLWPGMETTARAQELAAYQAGPSAYVIGPMA